MTAKDRRGVNGAVITVVAAVVLSMSAAAYIGFWIARDDPPGPKAAPSAFATPIFPAPSLSPSTETPTTKPPTTAPKRTAQPPPPPSPTTPDWGEEVIAATSTLTTGQSWSTNRLRLTVTADGNLVLRDQGRTVWQTGTNDGVKLVMQNDGHLVLYDASNGTAFSSGTGGNPGAVLILRADGTMVISLNGRILFQAGNAD